MSLKYYQHYEPSIATTLWTELFLFSYLFLMVYSMTFYNYLQELVVIMSIIAPILYYEALSAVARLFLKKKAYYHQNQFHEKLKLKKIQVDGPITYCRRCGLIIDDTYYRKIPLRFVFFIAKKATKFFGVKGYYCRRCYVKYSMITVIIVIPSFLGGIGTSMLFFYLFGDKLAVSDFIFVIVIELIYLIFIFIVILAKIFQYLNYSKEKGNISNLLDLNI